MVVCPQTKVMGNLGELKFTHNGTKENYHQEIKYNSGSTLAC